jgi:hypothetical protein
MSSSLSDLSIALRPLEQTGFALIHQATRRSSELLGRTMANEHEETRSSEEKPPADPLDPLVAAPFLSTAGEV